MKNISAGNKAAKLIGIFSMLFGCLFIWKGIPMEEYMSCLFFGAILFVVSYQNQNNKEICANKIKSQ